MKKIVLAQAKPQPPLKSICAFLHNSAVERLPPVLQILTVKLESLSTYDEASETGHRFSVEPFPTDNPPSLSRKTPTPFVIEQIASGEGGSSYSEYTPITPSDAGFELPNGMEFIDEGADSSQKILAPGTYTQDQISRAISSVTSRP